MIWDCFLFFNEFDLLDLRLHELEGVVDQFVVVESVTTHSGQSKPLYLDEVAGKYASFPIHRVIVEDPAQITDEWSRRFHPNNSMDWARENHQRNCIVRGLGDAKPDDVIMISDCDEIPRAEHVRSLPGRLGASNACVMLEQQMYYYYLNAKADGEQMFLATRALRRRDLDRSSPQNVRWRMDCIKVPDSGWHFGWLGGYERCVQKLEAFAHQELNRPEMKGKEYVEYCLRTGFTIHGMKRLYRVEPGDWLPRYVREHPEIYERYLAPRSIPEAAYA